MTDKEIIKALECCTGHHRGCNTCAYYGEERPCTQRLEADALKLIRRQQEKINHFVEANKMVAGTDKTEDEILKRLLTQRVEFIPNSQDVEDIKREAVREFADKLKEAFNNLAYDANTHRKTLRLEVVNSQMNWVLHDVTVKEIDKLFDKMFPEQKGEENGHRKN